MTEEIRPICLYVETCLDKKEGTRDCAKCEHHLNYWTEVMIRDMEKNINRLEQENKELKEENMKLLFGKGALIKLCDNLTKIIDEKKEKESKLWQALEEIRNYCNRIEQGSVIGTQDCLINSIKNITNEVLNND